MLLLVLMLAAIAFCVVYQRESWCRYTCPLGGLGAGYAAGSMIQVHANPSVCATQCTTHECFKGAEALPGCSVFHHPMYARDRQFCKLCLACLRSCPHGSARLYLRPPLLGLWRVGGLSETLAPFAMVVFFLAAAMLASHKSALIASTPWYTAAVLAATGAGLGLHRLLRWWFGDDTGEVTSISFAMLLLGAGPLLAFHLQNIPSLDAVNISARAETFGLRGSGMVGVGLLAVLQSVVVLAAAFFAAVALWRIRLRLGARGEGRARWGWRFVNALAALYVAGNLALSFIGGHGP